MNRLLQQQGWQKQQLTTDCDGGVPEGGELQNNNQIILKVRETATEAAPTTVVGPAPASSAALFMAAAEYISQLVIWNDILTATIIFHETKIDERRLPVIEPHL